MQILRGVYAAGRSLARTPGSALACVLTLSLGIAVSTVMFTLIHSLLLRPLPYQAADRVAATEQATSWGDVQEIEAHARTVAAAGVYLKRTWGFTDDSHAPVEVVLSGMVSHGFFDALGVQPARGERFEKAMEAPGANHLVWMTQNFWKRKQYAIGSVVALNDVPYRVAGVLPPGFRFPINGENADFFIPLDRVDYCCERDARTLAAVVRLAPGVSRVAAAEEISALSANRYRLTSLQTALMGDRSRPLLLLGAAAMLLLLVSAANAAAILLARAAGSLRDAAIKASLGANLRHLVQEQAAQGLVTGIAAAVMGIALAEAALHAARLVPVLAASLQGFAEIAEVRLDARVAIFAGTLAVATAVGAALAPLTLWRGALLERVLRDAAGSKANVNGRNGLVVAQIALSTVLLGAGAVVLDRLAEAMRAEKGFRTSQVVLAGIGIPEARYDTDAKMIAFHERVIEKLRAIPGVTDAGGGGGLPMAGGSSAFQFAGQKLAKKDLPRALRGVASPELLRVLDIPVVQGRGFTGQDRYGHPFVVLVNRRFVARYGKSVGDRLEVGFWNGHMTPWPEVRIVGVIGDARNATVDQPPQPAIYFSSLQIPMEGFLYFVRTSRPAAGLTAEFRQAVWSVDANIESVHPRPLAPYVEAGLESKRLALWLIGSFGFTALVLAAAGLGASTSAWVTESFREIGIRLALGDTESGIVWRVLRRSVRLAGTGLAIGIPLSFGALRLIDRQAAETDWRQLTPTAVVGSLILLAAATASFVPARRAAHLNPAEVLRKG